MIEFGNLDGRKFKGVLIKTGEQILIANLIDISEGQTPDQLPPNVKIRVNTEDLQKRGLPSWVLNTSLIITLNNIPQKNDEPETWTVTLSTIDDHPETFTFAAEL